MRRHISADDVRSFILEHFADPIRARGLSADQVPDDFDLLTEGVVDSLGILELLSGVEERFGFSIDFEDLDAEDLTIVGPLSHYVAEKSRDGGPAPP